MCKYDSASCPEAIATFNGAMQINNMKYGLGYDWDSVMPGVAAVLVTMKLEPVAEVAKTYLEGYVLAKWEVSARLTDNCGILRALLGDGEQGGRVQDVVKRNQHGTLVVPQLLC